MNTVGYRLSEMTSPEAEAASRDAPLVIIPIGALEQHGLGLPLSTDSIRAEGVAELVAKRLDGQAVLTPTLPVGVSPHHMAFAGTVTLTPETLIAVLGEMVDSLFRHGWRKMLIVTGHGGNNPSLSVLGQKLLVSHPDLQFAWCGLTPLAGSAIRAMNVSEVHGHSGEAETAQMLHLSPDLVSRDKLAAGALTLDSLSPLARLSRQSSPTITIPFDRYSPIGVLGDPRRSTPEQGEQIVTEVCSGIVAFAQKLINA